MLLTGRTEVSTPAVHSWLAGCIWTYQPEPIGFDRMLSAAVQHASWKRGHRHRRADQENGHHPSLMASDSERECVPPIEP